MTQNKYMYLQILQYICLPNDNIKYLFVKSLLTYLYVYFYIVSNDSSLYHLSL